MPTYEYRCKGCGLRFDVFHNMNDVAPRACPDCGEEAERMIGTGSGIIFKGTGFYATDYARGGDGGCAGGSCGEKVDSCPAGGRCDES